jgi:site-specific DNA-methyltransferase (adenine-specific)/adenine-specific DNA-methyltransferase
MNDREREELIRLLSHGEEVSPEWARILFPPEKREYELVYHGKDREEDIIANTLAVPLQKVRTFGKNGDDWHNMLIFGDNLQVMKSLLDVKRKGRLRNTDGTDGFRLVYIDPPFATKQDFRGTEDQKAYQDRIAGAKFLEFLRKRLLLIRELLADDGSLILHLDSKRVHYAKVLLDEVFGENRFVNEIIWRSTVFTGSSKAIANKFPVNHQTLLWYRGSAGYRFNKPRGDYKPEYLERFTNPDDDPRGPWQSVSLKTYSQARLQELKKEGRLIAAQRGGKAWRYKFYLSETKGKVLETLWLDATMANSMSEERTGYPTQKPEALLALVIQAFSDEGDIVFDAFAGSGSTVAVAEKLKRRWIGVDCGKLAIYTMQKRLLQLRRAIGNKGAPLTPKPFDLHNAGLYDFSKLKELNWEAWRFFALQLFQCRDEPHRIGGMELDGYLRGSSVLVFNHQKQPGVRIDEATIESMHEALGSKVGSQMFIVAPALVFDFQQDYLTIDGVRYFALRIPYSIIHELHQREFAALKQPSDELAVNETVDAVGFDFVRRPELEYETGSNTPMGELFPEGFIRVKTFKSEAVVRDTGRKRGNRETLSMVMLDYDFNTDSDVFAFDAVFYAEDIAKAEWEIRFPANAIGSQVMAVFLDIYGNEAREVIPGSKFAPAKTAKKKGTKRRKKRNR